MISNLSISKPEGKKGSKKKQQAQENGSAQPKQSKDDYLAAYDLPPSDSEGEGEDEATARQRAIEMKKQQRKEIEIDEREKKKLE